MTLDETVDALRVHLQAWYDQRKNQQHKDTDGQYPHSRNGTQPINPRELKGAVDEFMKEHPWCKEHEFDIYYDFVVKDQSFTPGCICGDGCDYFAHVTTTGIRVEKMDWEKAASNAQVL
jgi:hypothetical protein